MIIAILLTLCLGVWAFFEHKKQKEQRGFIIIGGLTLATIATILTILSALASIAWVLYNFYDALMW